MSNSTDSTLSLLAPPIRLVDWLERVWAESAAKGKPPPPEFVAWLQRWQAIRGDGPSEIDGVTTAQWAEVRERVTA